MNTIKKLRQEKELTQVQLAEILDIDQTTVSKWELEKALPDTQMLIRLAKFFDVSTDFLLGISSFYYPDIIKEKTAELSPDGKELLDIFNALEPMHRVQVLEYARYFAERTRNTKYERTNKKHP